MTTFAERAAWIEQLERKHAADRLRFEQERQRHELAQQQAFLLLNLYVTALTAPWTALAQELRR